MEVFLLVFSMGMMCAFAAALSQRDDADNTLHSVRFFAFHPSAISDESRLELIRESLKKGKR